MAITTTVAEAGINRKAAPRNLLIGSAAVAGATAIPPSAKASVSEGFALPPFDRDNVRPEMRDAVEELDQAHADLKKA